MKRQAGFTLIELMVVVAMIGILAAIAVPMMKPMWENARYKEAARDVTSALRDARSRAITQNLEYRVYFDLDTKTTWLQQGTAAAHILEYSIPGGVQIAEDVWGGACVVASDTHYIGFNPNGTALNDTGGASTIICILDNAGKRKFASGLESNTTGRIRVQRRNGADTAWLD